MESNESRRGWVNEFIDGRTFGSGLSVWDCPEMSVKDVALHEALHAYVNGLYLSTVLDAYAACEIWLVERIVAHAGMGPSETMRAGPESVTEIWLDAVAQYGGLSRTKEILREFRKLGNWIAPSLRNRVIELGRHKNAFAHYLPVTLSDVQMVGDGYWMAGVKPPEQVSADLRKEYACQAVSCMLDLWLAEVWTFEPGHCPDDSWTPPKTPG